MSQLVRNEHVDNALSFRFCRNSLTLEAGRSNERHTARLIRMINTTTLLQCASQCRSEEGRCNSTRHSSVGTGNNVDLDIFDCCSTNFSRT